MSESLPFVLMVFAGFFAIMNPITNTAIFIGLTEGFGRATKRRIAAKSTITAFFIVLVLALFGKLIFSFFGLTLPAFRITGGVLVFMVGLDLLSGETASSHAPVGETERDATNPSVNEAQLEMAISPLATPILAGPGTIVTAISFTAEGTPVQDVLVLVIFALICLWTYGMFISGEKLVRYLGKNAIAVVAKLMGLILATLGVHMLSQGIYGSVIEGIEFVTQH